MMKKLLWTMLSLILISGMSFAQKTVTGTVSGEDGPLAGASIIVKGTTTGTFSNIDGTYSVRMPEGSNVLVFKFSGYETQEVTATDPTVNVSLVPSTLDEVVVTAYGTQTKREITGSVATLGSEVIEQVQNSNVIQGLAGKVAGVQIIQQNGQPGAAPSVRFRGIGSVNASNQPLYVVDGVPYNGNINAIATQDIESMTFLKDASANALYGSRGANGVIIITTKKAKANGLNITLDMKIGRNDRMAPDYDVIDDPAQYYEAWYNAHRVGLINQGETPEDAAAQAAAELIEGGDFSLDYNVYNGTAGDQIIDPATGKVRSSVGPLRYTDNWENELFSPSARAETHLGISSKTDKTSTFFSIGYLDDAGYALQSGFNRITGRLSTDMQATSWLKVGANVNYANTVQDAPLQNVASNTYSNLFSWARNVAPIYPVFGYELDGTPILDAEGNPVYDFGTNNDGIPGVRPYGAFNNPVATSILDIDNFTSNNLSSRVYATIDFLEDFSFTFNTSIDLIGTDVTEFATPVGGDASNVNGRITTTASTAITFANQQLLNWDRTFGDHTFSVLLGHESNDWSFNEITAQKTEALLDNVPVLNNAANIQYANGRELDYRVEGYFSRIGYDFKNKYFLNASFRRDGSSVFGPDVRWGTFYGIGAAWDLTQESFMQNLGFFNNLRLKASFGQQGNDAMLYEDGGRNYYAYVNQFSVVNAGGGVPGVSFVSLGNPDLRWENSTNVNFGFDTRFWNDRISLEVEYFSRAVDDLLFYNPLPLSEGRGSFPDNVGDMENTGFEVTLGADVVKTPDFTWAINFNTTSFQNTVTRLPQEFIDDGRFRLQEGRSRFDYFMREFAGINPDNGESLWYMDELDPVTGEVIGETTTEEYNDATERFIDKTPIPDFYGGFGTFLSFKGLSLNVNFAYQVGGYGYDAIYQNSLGTAPDVGQNWHKDVFNSWTPENPNATIPRIDLFDTQNTNFSDFWLVDASFLALQDITLSYDLPQSVYSKLGLRGLRIYASGNNVALWSAREGYDPRLSTVGATSNEYSVMRSMSVGANVRF